MFFILSGEGISDIGPIEQCTPLGERRECPGPMSVVVDKIIEATVGYSPIEAGLFSYVREADLNRESKSGGATQKFQRRGARSIYFYKNALALGSISKRKRQERQDADCVAILFRDCDGTRAFPNTWEMKRQSILDGFRDSGVSFGVAMIPKPKSEAWIICAIRNASSNIPQLLDNLERESGNDSSPNSLKKQLQSLLGEEVDAKELARRISDNEIPVTGICTTSFNVFRQDLTNIVSLAE